MAIEKFLPVLCLQLFRVISCSEEMYACNNTIFCVGQLLDTVQRAQIFQDSKTFVDMKMKKSPAETLEAFDSFMKAFRGKPDKNDTQEWVEVHFEAAGQEFEDWIPGDWKPRPKFVNGIKDKSYSKWALALNNYWRDLGRKIKPEVKESTELYSIIHVGNPFVVPGGRFREIYYWDTYWIILGLLICEMQVTARGMLENFFELVEKYGHVPNGGRIYYSQRSQPPLLIPMVKLYLDHVRDGDFLRRNVKYLEKEFRFWTDSRTKKLLLDGREYEIFAYGHKARGPRPESYFEDFENGNFFKSEPEKMDFYSELQAAAEAGWDFSSRWFLRDGVNKGNLTSIKTRSIAPVDLNAIMCGNAKILSELYASIGDWRKSVEYSSLFREYLEMVSRVFWDDDEGVWLDYDLLNSKRRNYFYASNVSPLWTGCYDEEDLTVIRRVMKYLNKKDALNPGGIPTSFEHTGEQWDYPNAWPPLQHMVIVGLNNTGDSEATHYAKTLTERWINSNYITFQSKEAMFEKYDATSVGGAGGGGEYSVQLGFGWTNGVVLDLLNRYGQVLKHKPLRGSQHWMNSNCDKVHLGPRIFFTLAVSFAFGNFHFIY